MSEEHLRHVRSLCHALPGVTEKLSHGEPTFFVNKKVFTMFSNNHHGDGRIAIWIPAQPGEQEALIQSWPRTFYRPPYVGVKGWVGIILDQISDDDLAQHVQQAYRLIAPKPKKGKGRSGATPIFGGTL